MQMPNVSNVIKDSERNIVYDVVAYRELTRQELVHAVRQFMSMQKRKPKKGTRYRIITMIGARDRI